MRGLFPKTVIAWLVLGIPALAQAPAPLTCQPALAQYCANIHVGCAGRSTVATAAFAVTFDSGAAMVTPDDAPGWTGTVHRDKAATVIRRPGTRDWIRIDSALGYSQRIYRDGTALMTRGRCRHRDPPSQ